MSFFRRVAERVPSLKPKLRINKRKKKKGKRDLKGGRVMYSQDGEDLYLDKVFLGKSDGFYVDVGAYDPFVFSNTVALHRRGWRGINIDPNPLSIEKFNEHRPTDINLNLGVSKEAGAIDFFMPKGAGCCEAMSTFSAKVADELANRGFEIEKTVNVPVRPLHEILKENLPDGIQIDVLDIDVEGLDLEVLESNDWAKYRPSVVLVEFSRGETIQESIKHPIVNFMVRVGYRFVCKGHYTGIFIEPSLDV